MHIWTEDEVAACEAGEEGVVVAFFAAFEVERASMLDL